MICIYGRGCSGKDSIATEIVKEHNIPRSVTYTTRPMRNGEKDGKDYFYITNEEFDKKIEDGFFAETTEFNTCFGIWKYGSSKDSYKTDSVIILNIDGVRKVKNMNIPNAVFVYVDSDDYLIKERFITRGDDPKEAERRYLADKRDYKDAIDLADFTINNNGKVSLKLIADSIVSAYYGKRLK